MDFFHRLRRGDQLQALVYCLGPVTENVEEIARTIFVVRAIPSSGT